jgi:hypothetical protein
MLDEIKYNNNVSADFEGRVEVTVAASLDTGKVEGSRFNGFAGKISLTPMLAKKWKDESAELVKGKASRVELKYNYPDSTLYAVLTFHFNGMLEEKELTKVGEFVKEYLGKSKEFVKEPIVLEETEHKIELTHKKQGIFVTMSELVSPEDYVFLTELFEDEKDSLAYPEFLNNKLMFEKLSKLCAKLKLEVPGDAVTGVMLPVHKKDPKSGATLVHEKVQSMFREYKLAQNYVNGFEQGTKENQLGLMMMLSPRFSEYFYKLALRLERGGKMNSEAYEKELQKATKYISKNRQDYLQGRTIPVNETIS